MKQIQAIYREEEHGRADESPVFGIRAGCVSEFEIRKIKTKKTLIISGE